MADYVGFNTRNVVWECRCGQRKLVKESRAFGSSFSTNFTVSLNSKEMQQVLTRTESEELLTILKIKKEVHDSVFGS